MVGKDGGPKEVQGTWNIKGGKKVENLGEIVHRPHILQESYKISMNACDFKLTSKVTVGLVNLGVNTLPEMFDAIDVGYQVAYSTERVREIRDVRISDQPQYAHVKQVPNDKLGDIDAIICNLLRYDSAAVRKQAQDITSNIITTQPRCFLITGSVDVFNTNDGLEVKQLVADLGLSGYKTYRQTIQSSEHGTPPSCHR